MEPNNQLPPALTQKPEDLPAGRQELPKLPKPSKSRRSRKILYILIIILLILLGLSTALPLLSKSTNPAKKTSNNSALDNPLIQKMAKKLPIPKITMTLVTLAPTPTFAIYPPTLQPTLKEPITNNQNWKTYNNTTLNFSLSYPSYLTIKENEYGFGVADISFSTTANADPQNSNPDYQILIYPDTISKLIGHDFNTLYALPANTTERMTSKTTKPQLYTKIKNKTINGYQAFDFETSDDPPDPYIQPETGTYIKFENNSTLISTGQNNRKTLDQILSTFKSPIGN